MDFKEVSEKAFSKEPMAYPSLAAKYTYLKLQQLYKDYYDKKINKEKAVRVKAMLEREYNHYEQRIKNYYSTAGVMSKAKIVERYDQFVEGIEKSDSEGKRLDEALKFIDFIADYLNLADVTGEIDNTTNI